MRNLFLSGIAFACVSCVVGSLTAGEIVVTADFGSVRGPMKRLNGTNAGPCVKSADSMSGRNADFRSLGITSVRLHDIPLVNSGINLVDVKEIFPIWHAKLDPKDPENYFFAPTDDYVRNIMSNSSAEIVYRLGASIEHGPVKYFARRPADVDRYAEVCAGIVRHYTTGWANGFRAPISHWEIWNEADGCTYATCMWDGKWDEYIDMYVKIAKRLHAEFPQIKIGGPALTSIERWQMAEELVERCVREGVPLDFLSYHEYAHRPMVHPALFETRKMLDRHGLVRTEIHCNEWHYFPCIGFDAIATPEQRKRWYYTPDGLNGIDSAVYVCAQMTLWQDAPLDVANYYLTHSSGCFGLSGVYGDKFPTFYAVQLMGRMLSEGGDRIVTTASDAEHAFVLGGKDGEGRKRLLVSLFKPDGWTLLTVKLAGVPEEALVKVTTLDSFTEPPRVSEVAYRDLKIEFGRTITSAVRMVEW